MLFWILTFVIPLLPLIFLTYLAIIKKEKRIKYLLICLVISAFETAFGLYMSERADGLSGILYTGTIFIGEIGIIVFAISTVIIVLTKLIGERKEEKIDEK